MHADDSYSATRKHLSGRGGRPYKNGSSMGKHYAAFIGAFVLMAIAGYFWEPAPSKTEQYRAECTEHLSRDVEACVSVLTKKQEAIDAKSRNDTPFIAMPF